MSKPTRVVIVGAGAVGCFYGSRLHDPNRNVFVSLICRSNYGTISSAGGVRMTTRAFGDYFFQPEYVFPSIDAAVKPLDKHSVRRSLDVPPSDAEPAKWDYIIVTTKALPDVSDDSARIESLVKASPNACIVLIQNGVGVEAPYRKRFGEGVVILSAVTVVSAEQVGDGVVKQNRWTRISVGPYTDGLGHDEDEPNSSLAARVARHVAKSLERKATAFVGLLKAGGIQDAEMHGERDLQTVRWHKLAINSAINPSSVLSYGATTSALSQDPDVREHLHGCMVEIFQGAEAVLGRPFPPPHMKLADPERILNSTARNDGGRPSMLGDWERGAAMELEVILGNPIRAAKAHGVEMPRLQSMYALLKMAQTRRSEELRTKSNAKL